MDAVETLAGRTVHVDRSHAERGTKAPFFVVYVDADRTTRWGFWCSNCETLDTAVDSMGRIECNQCKNLHKAEEWDAAHE